MRIEFRPLWRAKATVVLCLPVFALVVAGGPLFAQTNLLVAADGSTKFKSVQEAKLTETEAGAITPGKVLGGSDGWNPKATK